MVTHKLNCDQVVFFWGGEGKKKECLIRFLHEWSAIP